MRTLMNVQTRFSLIALFALVLVPGALFAQETPEFLTSTLSLGSEGEEVALLQTWLASDAEIYPEGSVTSVYDAATESAVKRYQERQGVVLTDPSGESMYGEVGPITRADLNARFSSTRGGIAVVEGPYAAGALWKGDSFVPFEQMTSPTPGAIASVELWVKPAALTEHDTRIFTVGEGYSVGTQSEGKIFAQSFAGKAVSIDRVLRAGEWQHIAVYFTNESAVIVYNDAVLGTYTLQPQRPWTAFDAFFDRTFANLFGGLVPTRDTGTSVAATQSTEVVAPVAESSNIFGKIASFFRGIFGLPEPAPTSEPAPVVEAPSVPEEPEPVPAKPETPATTPNIFAGPPKVTLPPAPAVFPTVTTTKVATTTLVATTTATSTLAVATTTATSTDPVATSTDATKATAGGSSAVTVKGAPVITLQGSELIEIDGGDVYNDPGASAKDDEDGNLTKKVVISGDKINYNKVGDYKIKYNVTDSDGNKAVEVIRIVRVVTPAPIPESQQQPRYSLPGAGEDVTYTVSSGTGVDPKFVSVEISPLHVYVGQTQTFTVKVSSAAGVESVTSETELDTTTLDLPLTLKSSSGGVDTYEASWVVYDTHVKTYLTTFTAESNSGSENSITMAWSDPCPGLTQGSSSSVSSNCSVSSVAGLDGGTVTIPGGVTLTLNSGATWAWNPGTSIIVDGAIVKASGAQLRKGYLFYSGSTNETANTSSFVFDTNSSLSGHVRANAYTQGYYYAQGYYYSQGYYQGGYYFESGYGGFQIFEFIP
ncbi:DUF5011 domain-containing protein [Patescibacteria group bacterium]|nr:DUF5011 domain-containing protein [Patescibacteria group bacterium]